MQKESNPLSKDLVAASAGPLVLSILLKGESYGYAIIQRVHQLSQGRLCWTDGMLYPILHRLEQQHLVRSVWKQAENGRKRKYYRLSADGRRALAREQANWDLVNDVLHALWEVANV
jgi:DNA-binding PadR family transcriptional regulator